MEITPIELKKITQLYSKQINQFTKSLQQNLAANFAATSKFIQTTLQTLKINFTVINQIGILATINGEQNTATKKVTLLRGTFNPNSSAPALELVNLFATCLILKHCKKQFSGTVKLLFQFDPITSQSSKLLNTNVLKNPNVNAVFTTFPAGNLPTGTFNISPNYFAGSNDHFAIKIIGKGGHASTPHSTVDAVYIAAQLINSLHAIVSRKINPFIPRIVSITKITAGSATNIIADTADLYGVARTTDPKTQAFIKTEIAKIANEICTMNDAKCTITYTPVSNICCNDKKLLPFVENNLKQIVKSQNINHRLNELQTNDFAFFANNIPAFGFSTGIKAVSKTSKTKSASTTDQAFFNYGTVALALTTLNYLHNQGGKND
ncbi:MAG: amidohydrolase [Mycoplasmataceae bacterium]|jgi:amidohydrolase|nr:amidohydrolase [Mycoplasmataceae bacterium]